MIKTRNKIGTITIRENVHVQDHEMATAQALCNAGYDVKFIPNNDFRRSADIYLDGIIFEIKAPKGKNIEAVERNVKKAAHQSKNVIIDSRRIKNVQDRSVQNYLVSNYKRFHVRKLIFVNRADRVIDISEIAC